MNQFKSEKVEEIEDFLYLHSGHQRALIEYLHYQMMNHPMVMAKLRYKIPFYYRKSWICYIHPLKKGGLEFVFVRGNELSNEQGLLESKGRSQVRGITLNTIADVPETALNEIIQEALLLDEQIPYASKRSPGK